MLRTYSDCHLNKEQCSVFSWLPLAGRGSFTLYTLIVFVGSMRECIFFLQLHNKAESDKDHMFMHIGSGGQCLQTPDLECFHPGGYFCSQGVRGETMERQKSFNETKITV